MGRLDDFDPESYHRWRWRSLAIWGVALSATVIISLAIFRHDSARVTQLEKTNCALKTFLYKARNARLVASNHEQDGPSKADRQAARGYQITADQIIAVGSHCNLPVLPKITH